MPRTTVVIIGAGQAGLAMSHCLSTAGIEHVVLERGAVAQRWRTHGWDSLRLLTPNWMTRLPGFQYRGDDPHGFMTTRELVAMLEQYAVSSRVPVMTDTTVLRVERSGDAYHVATTQGTWCAPMVVIATGHSELPAIPPMSAALPPDIMQVAPADYRNPAQLLPGSVLVVGASATGVQLADEIQQSGRQVVLAVGRHTRLPRRYRGRDILWWLDRLGILSQEASSVHDLAISRGQPSLQLIGRPDHASLSLADLRRRGVRLAGRVLQMNRRRVTFGDDLLSTMAAADIKLATVLMRIDEFIRRTGMNPERPEPFVPTWSLDDEGPRQADLQALRIRTVIWATGYRRSYSWLQVPVLDRDGEIRHQNGVTPAPGLYVLGLLFQRRRNSSFIDGVGNDACYLAEHIASSLEQQRIA